MYLFFFGYQNTEVILSGHINDVQLLPDNCSINVCQHGTFSAYNLLAAKTAFLAEWRYFQKNTCTKKKKKRENVKVFPDEMPWKIHDTVVTVKKCRCDRWLTVRYFVYNPSELVAGTFLKIVITMRSLSQKVVLAVTTIRWYTGCLDPFCKFQRTNTIGQDLWSNNNGLI